MNPWEEAKKRPVMSGITLVGAAGAILLFMNVMPGLEMIVSIKKAPEIAQAALQKAEEANDWIAAYIAEAKKQRELDQKLAEQAAEYQRQMLELQRQQQQWQVPNQPVSNQGYRSKRQEWQNPQDGSWWCCTYNCEVDEQWYLCD